MTLGHEVESGGDLLRELDKEQSIWTENSVLIYMPGADLNETTLRCQGKVAPRPGRNVLVGDQEIAISRVNRNRFE